MPILYTQHGYVAAGYQWPNEYVADGYVLDGYVWYDSSLNVFGAAFAHDAFQSGAFQSEIATEWAFQQCAFDWDAFQADECGEEVVEQPTGGWSYIQADPPRKMAIPEWEKPKKRRLRKPQKPVEIKPVEVPKNLKGVDFQIWLELLERDIRLADRDAQTSILLALKATKQKALEQQNSLLLREQEIAAIIAQENLRRQEEEDLVFVLGMLAMIE